MSEILTDTDKEIGELLLEHHKCGIVDLTIALPTKKSNLSKKKTADFKINGNTLCFSSLEARNRFLANYLFDKNREEFQTNSYMWLQTAHEVWCHEIGNSDSISGRLLALLHKNDDIFLIAASAIESGKIEVFNVLHVIESALPYLNEIKPKSIYSLCSSQHEKTKNDLMAGAFLCKLQQVLTSQPGTCRLLHTLLRSEISQTTVALHPTALQALAYSSDEEAATLAFEDAESQNVTLKRAALWTLGRLLVSNLIVKTKIIPVVNVIIANISDPDEQVRRTAIYAAAEAIIVTRRFDAALLSLGKIGDPDVLAAISHQLMLSTKNLKDKAIFKKLVRLLCMLKPTFKGAIDNFDFILRQLLSDEKQQQFVISCLTEWAEINGAESPRDKSFAELFDSTAFELVKRKKLLSQIITEWLNADNWKQASAVSGLLSHLLVHNFKTPEFSPELLETFNHADFLYLVRRMLGFVHSDDHLISLTMSLLKIKNPRQRVFGIVQNVLVEEVGMDYPGSTIKRLEEERSTATDPELIAFYSSAIEEITSKMDTIEALPRIEELKPPPNIQRQFSMVHAKQMSKMMDEARKKSIFSQIATEIPMKGGKGWFCFRDGGYTDTSNLQSHSHFVALPRRHVLDSVGYELRLMSFRLAKREGV